MREGPGDDKNGYHKQRTRRQAVSVKPTIRQSWWGLQRSASLPRTQRFHRQRCARTAGVTISQPFTKLPIMESFNNAKTSCMKHCDSAAINHQTLGRHEAGFIAGEKDGCPSDLLGPSNTLHRMQGIDLATRRLRIR